MTRVRLIPATAAAGTVLALTLAGCSASTTPSEIDPEADISEQTLTVSNWAGYLPEGLLERFEEETGVQTTLVNHATNEDIVAKLTASSDPGIDIAFMSGQTVQALADQGMLAELEKSLIPNEANLFPEAMELPYDEGNVYSMPYTWGTTGLCYRSDLIDEPTSWNDLLLPDADADGKTTMLSTDRWLALPALKALGYSVNTTDDAELAAAKELLIDAKQHLLAYDDTTFAEKLDSGEAVLVEAWDGWCYGENEDIRFTIPEEGSDLWVDTMTVLESSPNKEAAMAFIDFVLDEENQRAVTEYTLYLTPNEPAMAGLDPELVDSYPTLGLSVEELTSQEAVYDLGEDTLKYVDLNTEILAAG